MYVKMYVKNLLKRYVTHKNVFICFLYHVIEHF